MRKNEELKRPNPLMVFSQGFSLGAKIQEYRSKSGLSQAGLASLLDTNRNTIVNWETGKTQPDYGYIRAMAQILGFSLYELFDLSSNYAPSQHEAMLISQYRRMNDDNRRLVDQLLSSILQQQLLAKDRILSSRFHVLPQESTPAAAGAGCMKSDCPPEPMFVAKNSLSEKADSIVRVSGNSMRPVYKDGDFVYIKYTSNYENGDDVICVYSEGFVIKRAFDGKLYSLNLNMPFGEHSEDEGFRIMAKVLGVVRTDDLPTEEEKKELSEVFSQELREFDLKYNRD